MIKAIIFDCYGVVVNDTFKEAYGSLGGDYEKDHVFVATAIAAANKGLIPRSTGPIAERLGVSEATWIETMASGREINMQLLGHIKDLRVTYRTGMLTNIGKGGLANLFEAGFLDQFFDVVVASSDIGYAKPEARAFEITTERLGVRLDECVFIDDREPYIEGAQHVGMKTILYTDFESFSAQLKAILEA